MGGRNIYDWDHAAHGSTSFDTVLIKSYNIGTTSVALQMTSGVFYKYLADKWGVNARTGIDLEGEATGILHQPGDSVWSDSSLATNSFGQGLEVTPLQMLCYTNTIANDGQMMQPHVVLKRVHGDSVYPATPFAMRSPVSADAAHQIRDIMVQVSVHPKARVIKRWCAATRLLAKRAPLNSTMRPSRIYDPYLQEATFVGFLPADEPRVSILIKLDNVSGFASQTAAPAFAELTQRLVVLMNIPTDAQRALLRQQGGVPSNIPGVH